MGYVIAIGVSAGLFFGFLIVTRLEARRGARLVAAPIRARLDGHISRFSYIAEHVDFPSFLEHTLRTASERLVHDTAHAVLLSVRFIERMLTRAVQQLRRRRALSEAKLKSRSTFRSTVERIRSVANFERRQSTQEEIRD